ncbi:hypothetical protein M5X04_04285 [Paenibacillus alvei]|uniref:RHS repeat-associated core domain-containing protein n=1 Tax=Paenibacillus alvei TaxID=44250 RepID=A0ABT4E477_PAEAL|nr:hypothetical protein [Paenibacillus alvei]MCY9528554.1 hypothetical protein [Paenibacillus alvei]
MNLYTYVENNPLQYIDPTGNSKCAFTETAMECVGNGKGGGGGSAGNSYVGSTVVRGNAAPPPKITRASPSVKFEVSWNEAKSFNKLNIEKAMKPKVTGKNTSVTVNYGNSNVNVYRGGNSFQVKPNEVKIDKETGLVKTTHGISLDTNPNTISKFGGAYRIDSLPDGLKIIQRGSRLEHFEIVPSYNMPLKQFQELLNQIKVTPVK